MEKNPHVYAPIRAMVPTANQRKRSSQPISEQQGIAFCSPYLERTGADEAWRLLRMCSKTTKEPLKILNLSGEKTFKKNEVIRKLKSSMLQREKMSEDFTFRMLQDVENQNLSYRKTSEGRRANMQQDINQLCTQLKNLITKNREVEMTLRKKRNKVESEIENWIQKYDADMGEKQVELEEVSVYYAQESKELQELEEHYKVLELEFSQIMDERRLAQELKEEEERERVIKEQNAVIIQAYWRGFQVRKEMKGKPTGKKGKKGKGRKIK
ncbi:dynein regulatory complex protein 10 isoform X6 [Anguilla rostrata]|uniref:dynein regulatory complex protein 10 isoform X6 n=1 Tax=Anguilla rostrata TaxID=7938 RepID=UPI0030D2B9EA